MSREQNVMQHVLDLLTDGILTSKVRQIGYLPHDKVTGDMLPFVQIYSAVIDSNTSDVRNITGTTSFNVDIITHRDQMEELRVISDNLDQALREDRHWESQGDYGFATLRSVAERPDDNRSYLGMQITVQLSDDWSDDLATHLCDFTTLDNLDVNYTADTGKCFVELSTWVHQCWGIRKVDTQGNPIVRYVMPQPVDMSAAKRVRLLMYNDQQWTDPTTLPVRLRIHSTLDVDWSRYDPTEPPSIGWSEYVYDLVAPPVVGIGNLDLSAVTVVDFTPLQADATALTEEYSWLLADFFFTDRDTGTVGGYTPGF